jgi:glutamate synthase domain-containing protein 3
MFYVAEEARQLMAKMGFRSINEMVGRADRLRARAETDGHWKASRLDFSDLLHLATPEPDSTCHRSCDQDHGLDRSLDQELLRICKPALNAEGPVDAPVDIRNVHRTAGGMLAGEVARRFGQEGLPDGTITLRFSGSAGQSFGAFMMPGMRFYLSGDGNDYVGKGMAGGFMAVYPGDGSTFKADENILIGNTSLYGATGGKAFFSGVAGERFCVRNSGATAVVEGVGDHGCEYMTGGLVVVLGRTGRNFGAGMSGGYAFVFDEDETFRSRCNMGMVELEELSTEDANLVAGLLEEHVQATGSGKARRLLAGWDNTLTHFIKVVPTEYRRVLEQMEKHPPAERSRDSLRVIQTDDPLSGEAQPPAEAE